MVRKIGPLLLFAVLKVILTWPQLSLSYIAIPNESSILSSTTSFDPTSLQILEWAATNSQASAGFVRDDQGCPVPSLTASLAIGQHGNLMLQDVHLINKLTAFNRERIPERVVHAKGHGAFGYFRVTHDISTLTKAEFLNGVGKVTPALVRFSTVAGESGTSDIHREGKGFAMKFYTNDGIFDLVGNIIGVFGIRDPMLFNDINKSRKRNPQTHILDNTMRWDYNSRRRENVMHTLMTSRDFPANSRVVDGFGVHAFKFVNINGVPVFVKFHFLSQQPFKWFNSSEIEHISGQDPDYATRDLFNAIENKQFPRWLLYLQVMTVEQALQYPVNPFDITKLWRKEEFPLIPVGELVLDRNPENYFNDIEQAAFSPARMVPGIEPSPDRMLLARMFSYPDSQRYRLTPNYPQLEVNRPRFEINNYNRDGIMRDNPNGAGGPNYFPNSFHGPLVNKSVVENAFHVKGIVSRFDTGDDLEDNFAQARLLLYRDLTKGQRERLAGNLAGSLSKAVQVIRERAVRNLFFPITPEFGQLVWDKMLEAVERHAAEDIEE